MNPNTNINNAAAPLDVAILGGGLAGLSLAIQLRQRNPRLRVGVFERRAHPVPEGAFKVGESTVEIGAHYFSHVLGLREHLDARQIRKFGFRFFFSEGCAQLDRCTELGVSRALPAASWQIDRGRFENFLGAHARKLGADFHDGAMVREINLDASAGHRLVIEADGATRSVPARWVVDASGRAGLLKRKLGLGVSNAHAINAVWWRVAGVVDPNAWSQDPAWLGRCDPPDRWRSTNHLCGPGYWLWLIPLASGAHSLGIVCDAGMHPLQSMDTHDKAMAWLREHQPRVARALADPAHALQDFRFLRDVSYGCKQVFSADRWALTGEAAMFLDPFYSPGSDFIAIASGYICDLIEKDVAGKPLASHAQVYEQLFRSFYDNTLTLFQDQYPLFGDAQVMPVKVIWDYTFYWALLAPLYFAERLTDLAMLGRLRAQFGRAAALNLAMQSLLRDWGARNDTPRQPDVRMLDQYELDWFRELNRALSDALDDTAFFARMQANVERMQWLAAEILARARSVHADIDPRGLDALPAGAAPPACLPPAWYAAAA